MASFILQNPRNYLFNVEFFFLDLLNYQQMMDNYLIIKKNEKITDLNKINTLNIDDIEEDLKSAYFNSLTQSICEDILDFDYKFRHLFFESFFIQLNSIIVNEIISICNLSDQQSKIFESIGMHIKNNVDEKLTKSKSWHFLKDAYLIRNLFVHKKGIYKENNKYSKFYKRFAAKYDSLTIMNFNGNDKLFQIFILNSQLNELYLKHAEIFIKELIQKSQAQN